MDTWCIHTSTLQDVYTQRSMQVSTRVSTHILSDAHTHKYTTHTHTHRGMQVHNTHTHTHTHTHTIQEQAILQVPPTVCQVPGYLVCLIQPFPWDSLNAMNCFQSPSDTEITVVASTVNQTSTSDVMTSFALQWPSGLTVIISKYQTDWTGSGQTRMVLVCVCVCVCKGGFQYDSHCLVLYSVQLSEVCLGYSCEP